MQKVQLADIEAQVTHSRHLAGLRFPDSSAKDKIQG